MSLTFRSQLSLTLRFGPQMTQVQEAIEKQGELGLAAPLIAIADVDEQHVQHAGEGSKWVCAPNMQGLHNKHREMIVCYGE